MKKLVLVAQVYAALSIHGIELEESAVEKVLSMNKAQIRGAKIAVRAAKQSYLKDQDFVRPSETLLERKLNSAAYNRGSELAVPNFELNNGKRTLCWRARKVIQLLTGETGITCAKMALVWSLCHVLFFGKPPEEDSMVSERTLRRHLFGLADLDAAIFNRRFEARLRKDKNFQTLFYIQVDDSKFSNKETHHVLIMSFESELPTYPGAGDVKQFRALTSACGGAKGGSENASLNMFCMLSELSLEVLSRFGGGTSDHANDAKKEKRLTFSRMMEHLKGKDPKLSQLYGVERRELDKGCNYHVDNLAMKHFSLAAFGPTIKLQHSQVHHRCSIFILVIEF